MGAKYVNKVEDSTGYKKTKIGVLPSDWEVKKLSDVSCINRESLNGNIEADYEFYYYDLSCVDNGKIYKPNNKIKFKDAPSRARRVFQKNDILFSMVRPYLKGFAYIDFECKDCICSTGFSVISSNKANDAKFIYYNLFGTVIENQVNKLLVGSNYPAINSSDVENLKIPYPKLDMEREKIGHILSTWDKAIELKEKLIEQKKEQKKGLMQRLLTGKVRLPGFEGEWKKVRLGSIGSAYNGLTGKNKEDFGSGKPYIPYKNVFNGSRINIDQLEYVQISETEKQNKVKYGDIIFTTSSETPEEVGMSSVLLDHVDELYLNSFCFGYRLNDFNTLIPEFAQYLFRGNVFRKELLKLAQGSTRFNLSKNEVLKIKIKIPGLEEQKKIASVLTIFDREIDLLEQKLESLNQQKKGLMQLLLTGKVRVKC